MIQCLFIVALPAEARPLIGRFGLHTKTAIPYRLYQQDSIALVETGLGKLNAAAATSAALCSLMTSQARAPACLNVGLAGSDNDLGTLLRAHRVTDADSNQKWYPQQTWQATCDSTDVLTVSQPETRYRSSRVFDMEASGVLSSATRHTTLEFIQCLKIVSDNPQQALGKIDKTMASELIASNTDSIKHCVEQLVELRNSLPDNTGLENLLATVEEHYKPSSTHRVQIANLLQRYQALHATLPAARDLLNHKHTRTLLNYLQALLDRHIKIY